MIRSYKKSVAKSAAVVQTVSENFLFNEKKNLFKLVILFLVRILIFKFLFNPRKRCQKLVDSP